MPRKKFDKNTSTTFHLVHRPQHDPKIHDESSNSMVFQELAPSQAHKIKNRQDLESDLFGDQAVQQTRLSLRDNEGEAAEYGVFYDDTEYDYMQHMRDINGGNGDGESYYIEAKSQAKDRKGKTKTTLEEALRNSSIDETQSQGGSISHTESLFGADMTSSSATLPNRTYQSQQDVPDELAGFQPNMDPRLREVLEALDDDAYVDDEEDIFGEITKDGREISRDEFEDADIFDDEGDDGWESDTTEKPDRQSSGAELSPQDPPADLPQDTSDNGDGAWMKEFSKFKATQKALPTAAKAGPPPSDLQSSVMTGTSSLTGGRHKKRKGAMTSSSGYSMTSSSLARTEGLTLLDARFDKIEEEYADDGGDFDMMDEDGSASIMTGRSNFSRASQMSGRSGYSVASSQAPDLTNAGLDGIMDDFLGGYSMSGKRRVKKGGYQSGLEQLDEVRKQLGPARLKGNAAKVS